MFVTVKFGENEEGIFNPQCKCVTLLSTIREHCCAEDVEVDLSDESGNVKNLREWPNRYADELLTDRETLVLLRVHRTDGSCQYTPLLNDSGFLTETFMAQLERGDGSGQQGARRARSSHRRGAKDTASSKNAKAATNTNPSRTKTRLK